ncbi:HlyD family efflux transporter periplasmic adaptor subunit [bacterium]|nr:HlyD family efflux transporter periplasmic adaptor subunit [bacterium]
MRAATDQRRGGAVIIWVLAAFFVVFVIWAYNASLDQIVRGSGVIVPSTSAQVVQSLEGGIVEKINVREGDIVKKGQIIARLNETRYRAEVEDFESQILTIEAKLLRLHAELDRRESFVLPEEIRAVAPNLASSEEQLFTARLMQFNSDLAAATEQYNLETEKVSLMETMVAQQVLPAVDLLTAKTAANEARSVRDSLLSTFALDRSDEISGLVADLARLRAQVEQSNDQLARSRLLAPTDGIVNTIHTTTLGGVVQPGEPIFEITPLNDELLVEVRIRPEDIAFINTTMPTTVKLSAYDYTVYGSLRGQISQVSADTFEDETSPDALPYYKVLVALDPASLTETADVFEMRPGMLADAEVHVGERTVMQYLMKPLIKSKEALREP